MIAGLVIGVEREAFGRSIACRLPFPLAEERRRKSGAVVGIERLQPHRLAGRCLGLGVPLAVLQHHGAAMMGVRPVRLECNRLLGRGLCFFELVLLGKADRQKRCAAASFGDSPSARRSSFSASAYREC